jgi:hypothetical protein
MEINNLLDASVIIAVFGAMILYFGKLMSDIDVESHDRLDYSVIGGIFSSVWIIIPVAAAYAIYKSNFTSLTQSIFLDSIFYLLPLLFAVVLMINIVENNKLKKSGQSSKTSKKFFIKYMGNAFVLWGFSFFSIVSTFYWYSFITTELIYFTISSVTTFFVLSMTAMSYAFKKNEYPNVKIYLQNNPMPIEGIVLRYADFIYILENRKEVRINKDAIVKIEKA